MQDVNIDIHEIFGALTRPPMTWGVTLEYHTLNLMTSVIVFIACGSVFYLGMFFPLHAFGWMVCRYDPDFFSLLQKKIMDLPNLPNQSFWGVRSYAPW